MTNPFNIQPGDTVELTVDYPAKEPIINDGSIVNLPKGWQRKLIRFVDEGETAELVYHPNSPVPVRIPAKFIAPAKGTNR